jgi:hypothetical protein
LISGAVGAADCCAWDEIGTKRSRAKSDRH